MKKGSTTRPGWQSAPLAALPVVLFCVLVAGSLYGLYRARYSEAETAFQLQQVEYLGVKHLKPEHLNALVATTLTGNLLQVDLDRTRELLESEPWVREALVRRRVPGRLIVHILERVPAAVATIDNELHVVDAEGVVLEPFGPGFRYLDRPIIKGLRNVALENSRQENARRMALYLEVLRQLDTPHLNYSLSISEVSVEDPERVAVIPDDDPVRVFLGNGDFLNRYETFLAQKDLYERLKQEHGLIEWVDVTYDDKIIFHTPRGGQPTVTAGVEGQS